MSLSFISITRQELEGEGGRRKGTEGGGRKRQEGGGKEKGKTKERETNLKRR
jgi:hypothetical protein